MKPLPELIAALPSAAPAPLTPSPQDQNRIFLVLGMVALFLWPALWAAALVAVTPHADAPALWSHTGAATLVCLGLWLMADQAVQDLRSRFADLLASEAAALHAPRASTAHDAARMWYLPAADDPCGVTCPGYAAVLPGAARLRAVLTWSGYPAEWPAFVLQDAAAPTSYAHGINLLVLGPNATPATLVHEATHLGAGDPMTLRALHTLATGAVTRAERPLRGWRAATWRWVFGGAGVWAVAWGWRAGAERRAREAERRWAA